MKSCDISSKIQHALLGEKHYRLENETILKLKVKNFESTWAFKFKGNVLKINHLV